MKYAIWNNKGGVGKSFLSFVLSTELAHKTGNPVIVVDMCPQANLSETILGGNGIGSERLEALISERKTVGGYFDTRIDSPHTPTGQEHEFLIKARNHNGKLPDNLWIIPGDPSLELQSQVISQIGGQTLPVDAWKNVHNWLKDLITRCAQHLGVKNTTTFIDCNPSFSAYTELAMIAADKIIIPCSSDGSSARAIDNVGSLLYGITTGKDYGAANFASRTHKAGLPLPKVHSVLLNRSTQYSQRASKAFTAMFDEIKRRTSALRDKAPDHFETGALGFDDVPDSHSVAIVCSHLGIPLYKVEPIHYKIHDTNPKVNEEPLERYKARVSMIVDTL